MKKLSVIFLIIFMNVINCHAQQKQGSPNNKNKTMIIPNRNIKNIEIPNLEQMNLQSQKQDSIQSKNLLGENTKLKRIVKNIANNSSYSLEENDSKGIVRKLFIEHSKLRSLDEVFRDKKNVIIINKEWTNYKDTPIYIDIDYNYTFYKTGNLKQVKCYSSYIPVGNWYLYDEAGNEVYHIDFDKHFKMSLLQILETASKIKIDNHPRYFVSRLFDANHAYWQLEFSKSNDEQVGAPIVVLIDDHNGKIIYNESEDHQPDYKSSGIIDYNSIFNYMKEIFEHFDK